MHARPVTLMTGAAPGAISAFAPRRALPLDATMLHRVSRSVVSARPARAFSTSSVVRPPSPCSPCLVSVPPPLTTAPLCRSACRSSSTASSCSPRPTSGSTCATRYVRRAADVATGDGRADLLQTGNRRVLPDLVDHVTLLLLLLRCRRRTRSSARYRRPRRMR